MNEVPSQPGFWPVVKLLLVTARKRASARGKHQGKLLKHRHGKAATTDWGCLGFVLFLGLCGALNSMFVWLGHTVVVASNQVVAEHQGKILVRDYRFQDLATAAQSRDKAEAELLRAKPRLDFLNARIGLAKDDKPENSDERVRLISAVAKAERDKAAAIERINRLINREADDYRRHRDPDEVRAEEVRLTAHLEQHGISGFIGHKSVMPDLRQSRAPLVNLLLSGLIIWWGVMLAFQGEGLEMDLSRRRHPMWEWLASHPVSQRAVFMAEMLSPLAANPFFLASPCFWVGMFWWVHGSVLVSVGAGLLAGLPLGIAACCVGKALEIAFTLRLPPRSRGAAIGILSWVGYASFIGAMFTMGKTDWVTALVRVLYPVINGFTLPVFEWMMGLGWGEPARWKGVLVCWVVAAAAIAVAVGFSARATARGLAGAFGSVVSAPVALSASRSRQWLRDPLYRKELLWFWRDRGALVQVFLVPITMAASQVMNFRNLADLAGRSWHTVCGAAVIFGTYFLFVLGPRSLISEGPALWLPMTWPRGMESLLKAKAKLWWMIASGLVSLVLGLSLLIYADHWWEIVAVAVGWFLFSGSLAEKSVTLVTVPSSSGEPEPIPSGRRWAAQLGTFTFAVGVMSQNWSLAFVGIVYSWLTAAAMWQNFRARLPFLFDPWSEKLPPAPTLMHAMIAISAMTEGMAVIFGGLLALLGKDQAGVASSLAYGIAGLTTALIVNGWMDGRSVKLSDICCWPKAEELAPGFGSLINKLAIGAALGAGLGVVALGYVWMIEHIPMLSQALHKSAAQTEGFPDRKIWLAIMAVGIAPFAEEYLFRGLLFRALDREWGGWRAVAASSLFFAIYHPPLSWVPVAALGFMNAWLFRRSGHLAPCVLAHMAYNAVVVIWS